MAFTVQNDNGDVIDANAYISVAFFTSYHTDRNVEAVVNGEYSQEQIQAGIVAATDYIDNRWRFKGTKLLATQTTQFPRDELYDVEGLLLEGLPINLKKATAEYAVRAITTALAPDPSTDLTGGKIIEKTEKVGPLEETTKYAEGASLTLMKPYPAADMLLRDLLLSGAGRVIRA